MAQNRKSSHNLPKLHPCHQILWTFNLLPLSSVAFKLFLYQFKPNEAKSSLQDGKKQYLIHGFTVFFSSSFVSCRMTHPGQGLPSELVQDMFHSSQWATQEGLGLSTSRKLLKMMKGHIQYVREPNKSYFLMNIELQMSKRSEGS